MGGEEIVPCIAAQEVEFEEMSESDDDHDSRGE